MSSKKLKVTIERENVEPVEFEAETPMTVCCFFQAAA